MPALFTLIYLGGFLLIVLLLLLSLFLNRLRAKGAGGARRIFQEVRRRLGSTSTNRGLRALRWIFVLLAVGLFGFHIYWTHYAAEVNEKFQELSYKDLRNRRLSESTCAAGYSTAAENWKTRSLYRRDSSGNISRDYPMDKAMAHIFGSDRGDPGIGARALRRAKRRLAGGAGSGQRERQSNSRATPMCV